MRIIAVVLIALTLTACASVPLHPDWAQDVWERQSGAGSTE